MAKRVTLPNYSRRGEFASIETINECGQCGNSYALSHQITPVFRETQANHDLKKITPLDLIKGFRHIYLNGTPFTLAFFPFQGL